MAEWAARRFWNEVSIAAEPGGFAIHLDGRPVRTPAKAAMLLPSRALAEAIAAEWEAQDETVDPRRMPFTRTANSAIDNVGKNHGEIAALIADYGSSDLLCYRAEGPAELVARQMADWDPLLDWAAETFGARLEVGAGVVHVPQSEESTRALTAEVTALDPFRLAALHDLVALSGSLVVGLAVLNSHQTPEALWILSRIDEQWQEELWGADEEAQEVEAAKRADFLHAAAVLAHLNTGENSSKARI